MQEQVVFSQGGYPIGHMEPDRSYWAIKLNTGKWRCELDRVDDLLRGPRNLDWTLDICGPLGDWSKIVELWLICPPTSTSPTGNTARLPISPAGTAFQLKVGFRHSSIGQTIAVTAAQMIGSVTDQETGACDVFVFDYELPGLVLQADEHGQLGPWKTYVGVEGHPSMGTYRPNIPGQPSIAPIGRISFDVLGLHFGDSR